jgi:ATP-dependent protease ClpP protease subunit
MNWHTGAFCRATSRYLGSRNPGDVDAVRPLWMRSRLWNKMPELSPPLSEAEQTIAFAPPGAEIVIPHAGGLSLSIEGELLPTFPVDKHLEAIRYAKGAITIRMNSGGGDLASAFALHDGLLAAGPERVEVLIAGCCGSAATLILAAANRRRIVRGSRLWVHCPSDYVWGTASDLRAAADYMDALSPRMAAAYTRCCQPALVDKWLSGPDFFFDAQEAVGVGLCTEVVEPVPLAIPT